MNKVNYFILSAEQMQHIVNEFIRNGNNPVLIQQHQIPTHGKTVVATSDKPPQYAKQVVNLGRSY